jgi:hypothetical protein
LRPHRAFHKVETALRIIKSKRMRWAWHVARKGEKRNAYRLLAKSEGKISLGRLRRRWVDNIRMDLGEWLGVVWTGLVWLMIGTGGGSSCECGNEPPSSRK